MLMRLMKLMKLSKVKKLFGEAVRKMLLKLLMKPLGEAVCKAVW